MVVTRQGFSQIVGNAFAGLGFPADGPTVHEFPNRMFNVGSELSPINENMDKIVYGLTKWQSKITTKGMVKPDMITVQGKDYQNAVDNMNALFVKNMWSDGLPFVPPTMDRVNWILTGTDLSPGTVISPPGGVAPRGGIATVESIAVALAMANGRPEYLPVLIATVQAITDPAFSLEALNSTTCSVIPAIIVNGPIAKQIRLGSGCGLLGPDPLHPAGQVIGRAIRIIQMDLGGAIPGIGTMAAYGGMRATNAVFAEDEAGLPKGWNSLAVDRGFSKDANVVTASPVAGMTNVNMLVFGTKTAGDHVLTNMAMYMSVPSSNQIQIAADRWPSPDLAQGVALIPRGFAASLATVSGYSKADVKTQLWNKSTRPWNVLESVGLSETAIKGKGGGRFPRQAPTFALTQRPDQIKIVVAGGDQSGHGYWMRVGVGGNLMVSKKIQLPAKWDALLKQNVVDLGPLPDLH